MKRFRYNSTSTVLGENVEIEFEFDTLKEASKKFVDAVQECTQYQYNSEIVVYDRLLHHEILGFTSLLAEVK